MGRRGDSGPGSYTHLEVYKRQGREKEEAPVIGRVTLGEKRELGARQPSVILRAVHPGEDLWTVAKAYLTTDSDIMEASGLTSGEIFPGQMLLIPRKSS